MGVDKAEMRLGGRTLLEIAVGKLGAIADEVVVVGQRESVAGGARVIRDLRPGCGPMGGVEAALRDARQGAAVFVPVDMPLVPAGLLGKMVGAWVESGSSVCLCVADGRVQPLLSLLRAEVLAEVQMRLDRGEYKMQPMLEAAGGSRLVETEISTTERGSVWPGWGPRDAEWAARGSWFANLNTPEEFREAERCADAL